jgi:hypothetical protein
MYPKQSAIFNSYVQNLCFFVFQTNGQTDSQTDSQTDGRTNRRMNRQMETIIRGGLGNYLHSSIYTRCAWAGGTFLHCLRKVLRAHSCSACVMQELGWKYMYKTSNFVQIFLLNPNFLLTHRNRYSEGMDGRQKTPRGHPDFNSYVKI